MDRFEWIATAAFGLEGLVARELARLGIEAKAENGGARFFGSFEDAFRANLHARCADRILLVMGRFEARSFEASLRASARSRGRILSANTPASR